MDSEHQKIIETSAKLLAEAEQKKSSLYQSLLIATSSILGILISLHSPTLEALYMRLIYALSIALLALGIAAICVCLYARVELLERTRETYHSACTRTGQAVYIVGVNKTVLHRICEQAIYILLPSALLLLVVYTIWSSLAA